MKAKLPSSQEPGFKVKQVSLVQNHGEVPLVSLAEDDDDSDRMVYAIINDVLFQCVGYAALKNVLAGIPSTMAAFIKLAQNSFLNRRDSETPHKLLWQTLELPMDEWERRRDANEQRMAAQKSARNTFYADQERKKIEKEESERNAAVQKVRANQPISGPDLLALCRHFGVEIHPRTAGVLANKVTSVGPDQAMVRKGTDARGIYPIYAAVRKAVTS